MVTTKHTMKMPELLVFAKMFVVGLIAAEGRCCINQSVRFDRLAG